MTWWIALLGGTGGLVLVLLGIGMVWIGGRRKVSEEQRVEAIRVKRELEALIETPGWKRVEDWVERNTRERSNSVLLSPTENPLAQEYTKGEIQGLRLFAKIPTVIIEQMKDVIAAYNKERGMKDED